MKHKDVYSEIFRETKKFLVKKYSAGTIPSSADFESAVVEVMKAAAKGKGVEVRHLGKRAFPDIRLEYMADREKVGVEVKLHTTGKAWTTLGNSAYGRTQDPGLATIYLLFGHFEKSPAQFEIKPYGKCIQDIEITHNPRYMIDMRGSRDFCLEELGISFDKLRTMNEHNREIYVNTYIAKKKYAELSKLKNKKQIMAQGFVLFPEFFANNESIRYKRMSVWLFAKNILCRNVRDFLSASGTKAINAIGPERLPKIFSSLQNCAAEFEEELKSTPAIVLKSSWSECGAVGTMPKSFKGRKKLWLDLVEQQYGGRLISGTTHELRDTLEKLLK